MKGECGENTQEDEEIGKLIKERTKIAKSDKHRPKELSKQINKCIRDKNDQEDRNIL